jgi:iron complex transport system permease protein
MTRARSLPRLLLLLVVLLAAAAAIGLACGPTLGWSDFVVEIRLTSVVLAAVVGAGLATTGAVLQAMSGNPLADPFVLGASSGAAVGVVASYWLGVGSGSPLVFVFASLGAFAAILAVLRIARIGRRMPVQTLLLAGITVSTLGSAVILLYFTLRPSQATTAMLFLMGSLQESRWRFIAMTAAVVVPCVLLGQVVARALNAFAMGESTARHLGVDVDRMKLAFCLLSAAMVGAIVAVSGLIGFVGLIVPHMARRRVGNDHRLLLPACALGGASFLILADAVARTAAAPQTLSLGAITALCGGPYFLLLLRRRSAERDVVTPEPEPKP